MASGWNIGGVGGNEEVIVQAQLVGAAEFAAEADAVSGSLDEMSAAAETSGRAMEGASRRSFLMQQAMFTLRRFIYTGTQALIAAGGAAVYFGLRFDSNMQQSTVALTHFLGSSAAAHKELHSLYQLAAYTPFQFSDVTAAAKSMLAFGFSVNQTNNYLKTMADVMSGLGLSGQAVQQFTNDIVKMAARGKIMGQDIRELVSLHIPALKILQEQLHLTTQQIQNIGSANIPAQTAIDALMRGLEERYKGQAAAQAKTLQGRLSTLTDLTQLMLGQALGGKSGTSGFFGWLAGTAMPGAFRIITALTKGFGKGGLLGSLQELNRSNAPAWFKLLYTSLVRTWETIVTLYTAFKPFLEAALVFGFIALYTINTGLGIFNRHATLMVWLLRALAAWWVYNNLAIWANIVATRALLLVNGLLEAAIAILTFEIGGASVAMVAWNVILGITNGLLVTMDALLWGNPIGLIILAVLALAAGFYLLWTRSKTFRDTIKEVGRAWLDLWNTSKPIVEWMIRVIGDVVGPLVDAAKFVGGLLGSDSGRPGSVQTGPAMSGHGGRGAIAGVDTVLPHPGPIGQGNGLHITVHSHVHVDRKTLGEAVARYNQDQKARQ